MQHHRVAERTRHPDGEVQGLPGRAPGEHHRELVATDPDDQPVHADGRGEPLRHDAQQLVAQRVAERVVDLLEAVHRACTTSTKGCSEVCPEGIHITDNALIPLKERVVDRKCDPLTWLRNTIRRRRADDHAARARPYLAPPVSRARHCLRRAGTPL